MGEREITARSDVYALGAMTYEMLVGEPPFTGPTAQAIVAKVMTDEPAGLTAQRRSVPAAGGRRGAHGAPEAAGRPVRHRGGIRGGARGSTAARPQPAATAARPPARRSAGALCRCWARSPSSPRRRRSCSDCGPGGGRRARSPGWRSTSPTCGSNYTGFYGIALAIARDGSRMAFVTRSGDECHPSAGSRSRRHPAAGSSRAPTAATGRSSRPTASGSATSPPASSTRSPPPAARLCCWPSGLQPVLRALWLDDGRIVYHQAGFRRHGGPVAREAIHRSWCRRRQSGGQGYPGGAAAEGRAPAHALRQHLRRPGGGGHQPQDPGGGHHPHRALRRAFYLPTGILVAIRTDGSRGRRAVRRPAPPIHPRRRPCF